LTLTVLTLDGSALHGYIDIGCTDIDIYFDMATLTLAALTLAALTLAA